MSYKLSDKQKDKIIALAKQGYSNDMIAKMVGCHEWSVWKIRKNAGMPHKRVPIWSKGNPSERCKKCFYHDKHAGLCDYLLLTGERRGCPGGDECNKWRPKKGKVGDVRKRYQHRTEGSVCNSELSQSVNDAWNADMRNMEVQGVPESETCQRCKWYGEETGICCNGEADAFMDDVEPDDGCGWYDDGSQNALNGL